MEKHIDLQTFHEDALRVRGTGSLSETKGKQEFDRDRYELARVGKRQVLKVRLELEWVVRRAKRNSAALDW